MAPPSGLPSTVRFPWILGLVAVAFLLGVGLGRAPTPPSPPPEPDVEIRVDTSELTLLPDASLRFDLEPKEIDDFRTTDRADFPVDDRSGKR